MIKPLLVLGLLSVITACDDTPKFVDKRFYRELIPYSRDTGKVKFTKDRVISDYGPEGMNFIHYCRISANKIGYLEYKCDKLQYCMGSEVCDSPIKDYEAKIIFKITERRSYYYNRLLVEYIYYSGNCGRYECDSIDKYELAGSENEK